MKFYTVIKIINEYAKSTTIHGINYIFQSGIPIIERLLWIVVMMIMVFFASLLSRSAYIEWEDHPVVTTVKSTGKSIKDVEFPSITICAQVNINTMSVLKYTYRIIPQTRRPLIQDYLEYKPMKKVKKILCYLVQS